MTAGAALADPKYKGKIMMLDNMLAAYIPALQVNGYDAGSTVKAEVDVATQWLMDQKPLLQGYNATNNAQLLAQGQVWIELAWNSQIVPLHGRIPGARVRPAGGGLLLLDRQPVDHEAAPRTWRTPTSSSSTCCSPKSPPRCATESGIAVPNTPMMDLLPDECRQPGHVRARGGHGARRRDPRPGQGDHACTRRAGRRSGPSKRSTAGGPAGPSLNDTSQNGRGRRAAAAAAVTTDRRRRARAWADSTS